MGSQGSDARLGGQWHSQFQNGQPVNVLTGQDNSGTLENEDRASITGSPLNSNRINLAQPIANLGYASLFGTSLSTIGVSYGVPGIGSGEPYNTQLALKIIF